MRRSFSALTVVASVCLTSYMMSPCSAVDPNPHRANALSPKESLKQIAVDPGLKVELVASEPNIMSPVAVRFDEDGRMWVVEMRDYPTGPTKQFPARSRVSVLTDKDGDGFYETATVFADDLPFATGVQPWKGGAFVTMSGKVMYLKDTDGDGKADVKETWYTGFSQGNQQLRANHPLLALDGHIYISNGLRGGKILDPTRPDVKPVSISGRDFRFDPQSRDFEAISGDGQFGNTFDDYGNRFICTNRNPVIHVVLEDRLLKKNPLVTVGAVQHDVAKTAGDSRLYSIGHVWVTSNLHEGTFTAACGVHVFRGDGLPNKYYGNVYTCDPTARVIHREIMKPDGVTFVSNRLTEEREFFATADEWTCPVNLETGPDVAMYVVDMYRQIIEHPEWMPDELKKRPNMRAGWDRGRIYRIVSKDATRPKSLKFTDRTSEALVQQLASANSWQRETAGRLLIEKRTESVRAALQQLAVSGDSVPTRICAIRLLATLRMADDELLMKLCEDSNPRIVEQGIIAAEPRVRESQELRDRISQLASSHPDARVRFNALLTATPLPQPPKFAADTWEIDAMLVAAGKRGGTVLVDMLQHAEAIEKHISDPAKFVGQLARLAAASKVEAERSKAVRALLANEKYGRAGLIGFFMETRREGVPLEQLRSSLDEDTRSKLDQEFVDARKDAEAKSGKPSESHRAEALDLVACTDGAAKVLTPIAVSDKSESMRLRAIAALARTKDLDSWKQLLGHSGSQSPAEQRAVLDAMFSSVERTSLLLDEIQAGRVKVAVVDPIHAKLLFENRDAAIRQRAEKVLASAVPQDREKVLARYRAALNLHADVSRGRSVFEKRCSICHRVDNVGVNFAPDISDSRERTPLQLLTDIIEPNRAVDSNYFSYTVITTDGRVHTGVLAAETSTSVTLKQQEGKSEMLRRDEIEELHNNGVSFMPEGLEKDIPLQDMADLISFIKNWRYIDSPHQTAGKAPAGANLGTPGQGGK